MRRTYALVQVALALTDSPWDRHWGYELSRSSGARSGVMYPMLGRMLKDGWLADGWESAEEAEGRRPRRYYVLTDKGLRALGAVVAEAQIDPRFRALFRLV